MNGNDMQQCYKKMIICKLEMDFKKLAYSLDAQAVCIIILRLNNRVHLIE